MFSILKGGYTDNNDNEEYYSPVYRENIVDNEENIVDYDEIVRIANNLLGLNPPQNYGWLIVKIFIVIIILYNILIPPINLTALYNKKLVWVKIKERRWIWEYLF